MPPYSLHRRWFGNPLPARGSWDALAAGFARHPGSVHAPLGALCAQVARSPLASVLHGSYGVEGLWLANRPEWCRSEDVLNVKWDPARGKMRFTYHELPNVKARWTRDAERHEAYGQLERIVRRLHWIVEYRAAGGERSGDLRSA